MANELRFPSIDALRAFEAAARLATFERAADELAVTASAVGKRIGTLEALIGSALFVRSGKALQLTASGREYLQQVQAALALLASMPQHQRAAQRLQKLRVSAPPTFARQILVPQLESFTAAHPHIELEIVLSIPFLGQQGGDADVLVRHGEPGLGRPLMHDVVLPLAAPAYLARRPPLHAPADLAHAALLRTPIEPWTPWLRAAGLDWPEPASGPKFVDLGLTLEAALSGLGVALGRPSLARTWLHSGALVAPFALHTEPALHYQLQLESHDEAATRFADWLAAACERWAAESLTLLAAPETDSGRA